MSELFLEQSQDVLDQWETTSAGLHTHGYGDSMRWRPNPVPPRPACSMPQQSQGRPVHVMLIRLDMSPIVTSLRTMAKALKRGIPALQAIARALSQPPRHDGHHPRPLCIDGRAYRRRRRARARRRRR